MTVGQSLLKYSKKLNWSRYRPGCGPGVGRGIALLFNDHGTRRGWVVCSTPRPYFTPGKDPVPIVQEAGWAPGPVWTAENLAPPGFDSRTVRFVVSRYTGCATHLNYGIKLRILVAVVQGVLRIPRIFCVIFRCTECPTISGEQHFGL